MIESTSLYNTPEPLVSICCSTYNHENYIAQTLEGFLMQKCNFPVEILINEDCSTDKTASIIKEYEKQFPDVIKPVYQKENQYSKGVKPITKLLFPRVTGKYIAICEGDDYWTDPYKLQKQVDFLETNVEYGMVYTEFNRLNQKSGEIESNVFHNILGLKENTFENFIINTWFLATFTWVFKSEFLAFSQEFINKEFNIGDLPLLLTISANSKVGFINETMGVYRVLANSASHSRDKKFNYNFRKKVYNIQTYYADRYNISDKVRLAIDIKYYQTIYIRAIIWNDTLLAKKAYKLLKLQKNLSVKYLIFYHLCKVGFVRKWFNNYYYKNIWKSS